LRPSPSVTAAARILIVDAIKLSTVNS